MSWLVKRLMRAVAKIKVGNNGILFFNGSAPFFLGTSYEPPNS